MPRHRPLGDDRSRMTGSRYPSGELAPPGDRPQDDNRFRMTGPTYPTDGSAPPGAKAPGYLTLSPLKGLKRSRLQPPYWCSAPAFSPGRYRRPGFRGMSLRGAQPGEAARGYITGNAPVSAPSVGFVLLSPGMYPRAAPTARLMLRSPVVEPDVHCNAGDRRVWESRAPFYRSRDIKAPRWARRLDR
jgi:hypothetical protein